MRREIALRPTDQCSAWDVRGIAARGTSRELVVCLPGCLKVAIAAVPKQCDPDRRMFRRLAQVLGSLAVLATSSVRADAPGDPPHACLSARLDEPQAVFDTAKCLASAGVWGLAAHYYGRILADFPQHPLAETSLLRLADGHRSTAHFPEAAQYAEQYAARYPQNKATLELLLHAAQIRLALGQRAQAVTDLDRAESLLQRTDPGRAAELYWSRRSFLATDDERLAHAELFLKRHAGAADLDRRIVAQATIATILWHRSCDKGTLHDLCLTRRLRVLRGTGHRNSRRRTKPPHSPPSPPPPVRCARFRAYTQVYARNTARAAEAQRYISAVLLAAQAPPEIPEDQPQRRREYEDAVATAALQAADQRFEALLAIDVPEGLFLTVDEGQRTARDPRARRKYTEQVRQRDEWPQRFRSYLEHTTQLAGALAQEYGSIVHSRRAPRTVIAAADRLGQLIEYRADHLLAIQIPAEAADKVETKAFCAELLGIVHRLDAQATTAFSTCLDLSTHSGEFTEASRDCEDSLHSLDPRGYPSLAEVISAPSWRAMNGGPAHPATRMQVLGVQQDSTPFIPADAYDP